MSSANRPTPPQRVTALCYVRLSVTRDESDLNSPERQRANIQAECDRHGWTPEWYEDVEGHKSGTQEDNRPGWLALKNRLGDSDVVAVVANDLSRLHRKGWRVGNLIDMLEKYGIRAGTRGTRPKSRFVRADRKNYHHDHGADG
jgi:DNA invertase Pin-like site-specific DNA recombinase